MARVSVAMSGGVDSSVAAALLVEQGHDVTGVTMDFQAPTQGSARASADPVQDARRVCDLLGIPHRVIDFHEALEQAVVRPFADAYAEGRTPNPCIECNSLLKFGGLMAAVAADGAELLATGHYARIVENRPGHLSVSRALDATKDQSYFLYRLTQGQLAHALFPLGVHSKAHVRAMAQELGLPTHDKAESQDVCFAREGHAEVVRSRRPDALMPGAIYDLEGRVLGQHRGLGFYTVGQRHGLALSGLGGPWYVVSLDACRNAVIVGPRDALLTRRVDASNAVWNAPENRAAVTAQTRYRMRPVAGQARIDGERLLVELEEPVLGVAPGQAVVCYQDDVVLGGGTIERTS